MEIAELRVILNRILRLYNAEDTMSIQLIHDLTELHDDSIDITECDTDDAQIKRFIQDINTKRLQLIAYLNKDTEEEEVEPVVERCVEAVHEPDLITFDDVQPKQKTIEELLEYSSASDKDLDDLIAIAPSTPSQSQQQSKSSPKQLITKQKFDEYKRDEPDAVIKSSYALGKIGEDELVELLTETRPDFIVTKVSGTGHVGDIHVDDEVNRIKYVVESKLKQKITAADITKFKADVDAITADCLNKYVYGIFVSLNSQTISTIGTSKCDKKTIYLTQQLVNRDIFKIIFEMVPLYVKSLLASPNSQPSQTGGDQPAQRVEYTIPQSVREVIAQLQLINMDVKDEEAHLNEILQSASNITGQASQLQQKLLIRKNYLQDINFEMTAANISDKITAITSISNTDTSLDSDREFLEYMRKTPKTAIKKKELISKFPQHVTELSSMTLDDIIKSYKVAPVKTAKTPKTTKK